MGFSVGGPKKGIVPEMNVTPLVDVVLVLLIIFMVIAPALEHGERVELPGIFHPDKKHKTKLDPITVTVGASGTLYYEKDKVDADTLKQRLEEAHAAEPERRIVLKGDSTLQYKKVREVFQITVKAGFSGIALMVQKRAGLGGKNDEGE